MSAKFDEFPSLPFQDIKEKPKCHGRMDNVKTVCRGYNKSMRVVPVNSNLVTRDCELGIL